MVNLHPDFYSMTFKLKPNRQIEGRPTGVLRPIAVYQEDGDVCVVCVAVGSGAVVDVRSYWLDLVPPEAD